MPFLQVMSNRASHKFSLDNLPTLDLTEMQGPRQREFERLPAGPGNR